MKLIASTFPLFLILALSAIPAHALSGAHPSVCDRTPSVRAAIQKQVSTFWRCQEITDEMLSRVRVLKIDWKDEAAPTPGDFNGLSSVRTLTLGVKAALPPEKGPHASASAPDRILKVEAFQGLLHLEELSILNFRVKQIETGAFKGLAHVEKLDLTGNPLTEVTRDSFSGLSALTNLSLSDTKIGHLEDTSFTGLELLEEINLSRTEIAEMDPEPFRFLGKLTKLNLAFTRIKEFQESFLEALSPELKLDLSHTPLKDSSYCKVIKHHKQVTIDDRAIMCTPR